MEERTGFYRSITRHFLEKKAPKQTKSSLNNQWERERWSLKPNTSLPGPFLDNGIFPI